MQVKTHWKDVVVLKADRPCDEAECIYALKLFNALGYANGYLFVHSEARPLRVSDVDWSGFPW